MPLTREFKETVQARLQKAEGLHFEVSLRAGSERHREARCSEAGEGYSR